MKTSDRQAAAEDLIISLAQSAKITKEVFFKLHRHTVEKFSVTMLSNDELYRSYHKMVKNGKIEANRLIEDFFKLKKVRSLSGMKQFHRQFLIV